MSDTPIPNVQSWKTEFDSRVQAFAKAVNLDEAEVRKGLKKLGVSGKDEDSLTMIDNDQFLTTADLFELFCDSGATQKARLRMGLAALRGKTSLASASVTYSNTDQLAEAVKDMAAANRPISTWTDKELLEAYNRDAIDVLKTLKSRVHGRPCIIFKPDGEVNVDASLELVRAAKKQPTSHEHSIDGEAVRVYRVGLFMPEYIDESPIYPGRALVQGYCSKSDIFWGGVCHTNRVLMRIYAEHIGFGSQIEMKQMVAYAANGVEGFKKAIGGKTWLRYCELEKEDKLPKLKISSKNVHDSGNTDTGFSK